MSKWRIETTLTTQQWDIYHAWHRAYPSKLHEELVTIALLEKPHDAWEIRITCLSCNSHAEHIANHFSDIDTALALAKNDILNHIHITEKGKK